MKTLMALSVFLFSMNSFAGLHLNVGNFWCSGLQSNKLYVAQTKEGRITTFVNGAVESETQGQSHISQNQQGIYVVDFYQASGVIALKVHLLGNQVKAQLPSGEILNCSVVGY